ncbi:MAG: hypothetical protein PVH63_09685 [Balneolaceae bacterium]|jgi:Tol biopolymer transport system component
MLISILLSRFLKGFMLAVILLFSVQTGKAQYFSFDKNRVQYNRFDWKYIQSQHFDIYYYGSLNYELADFSVHALESALKQLQEDFQYQIVNRIRVIIYDSHNDFSQTNVIALPEDAEGIGGVTDLYKNRITMPFSGNYTEFRSTLHHELIHAVFNDMFYGGNLQSVISSNLQLLFPNWFDEGLSEYESLGWDTNTDMWIRDAVINNYLPNIPQLGGYFAYRGGQSVWNYIVEVYGRQKIGEILQVIKLRRNVEAGIQEALGLSISELNSRWKDFYRKRYLPEVTEREDIKDFTTHLTNWTGRYTYNTSPAISPQGDKIAMITNARGYFDVVVVSAITGKKLKTLIKGSDNINFEELNILNPNLSWSPDGTKLILSAKSEGSDDLAIVDYQSGDIRKLKFPKLDAIGSVSWSPDGKKIAFDGNIGPYQDIFVYNLNTQQFINLTNDVISDFEPAWSSDSRSVYFVSARGDNVGLNTYKENYKLLLSDDLYSTDIYRVTPGAARAERLTKTPNWSEKQPAVTRTGQLLFISDQNGIPNIYRMDLKDRTIAPLTNLQSGVMQMSINADGSRLAVNAADEGSLDIFLILSPFDRLKNKELSLNEWARRRLREPLSQRVPATQYVRQMAAKRVRPISQELTIPNGQQLKAQKKDTLPQPMAGNDTTRTIDIRHYVFDSKITADTTEILEASVFTPENNMTEDGRYRPNKYKLKFTTDLVYAQGTLSTFYYDSYGIFQVVLSDLLGDHQFVFGTDLALDLNTSNYLLSYGNYKQRMNWTFSFSHSATSYETFSGQLYRFRTSGLSATAQYPLDKFRRIDIGLSGISIARDYSVTGLSIADNENSSFLYPQAVYTVDKTLSGYITPVGGSRYALGFSGSPPLTANSLGFFSVLGDYRKYFNMGYGYSFAVRGSGAASFGRDSQTYFLGGMLGWINYRWSGYSIPFDKLSDLFFTLPALPLRGYEYNSIYGDKFTLLNAEFRFPLFAAILPGPIPFLPLYNMTGVAFVDAGMAWGVDIPIEYQERSGNIRSVILNESKLNFKVGKPVDYYITPDGNIGTGPPPQGTSSSTFQAFDGDVLIGAGFGLRTIILGLPIRYDVGWPYYRGGFGGKPIHYISLGIDF